MPRQPQQVHIPMGDPPTRAVLPQKVGAGPGAVNVLSYDFGFDPGLAPNANIRQFAKLKESCHLADLFGKTVFTDPLAEKGYGILANFHARYANYKEFLLPDGTPTDSPTAIRNPLCLHRVKADRLDLVLRSNLTAAEMKRQFPETANMANLGGDSDTSPYLMGFTRLPVHAVPGTYVEVLAKWDDSKKFGAISSWPVIWTFTGEQVLKSTVRYYTGKTFECDAPDGYSEGLNRPLGESFVTGFPNGTGSALKRLYAANSGGLMARGGGDGHEHENGTTLAQAGGDRKKVNWDGVTRFYTKPETNPTLGYRLWGLHFHTDGRTIDMYMDGMLYSRVEVPFGIKLKDAYTEGSDPKIDPARGEEWLGHHIMVAHQGLPRFNEGETQVVTTRPEGQYFELVFGVKHIRVWRVPGGLTGANTQPPQRTEEAPLPAPQTDPAVLGDLPALATGTYVADVSAASGVLRDRFGNRVELVGDAKLGVAKLDGLPAPEHNGSPDGGVSIRGPVCARFQGAHRVYAFLAVEAINPYQPKQTLFSANRDFPIRDLASEHVGRVALTSYGNPRRLEARLDGASGAQTLATAGAFSPDILEVISLAKTTNAEGKIVLGIGDHANAIVTAPAATGGVPVSDLEGITEITLLCGRNKWGLPASAAAARAVRFVVVAVPDGTELSAADHAAVVAKLKTKRTV